MVDGIRVAEHCCVVALGITIDGTKVPLGLAEGATENATVVTEVLVGLRERGLEVTRPMLVVLDGAKALRRAVTEVFDHPVIQRCQLHKLRNVTDRLPDALASTVAKRMRRAYHHPEALVAQADLEALARELDRSHPGAAAVLAGGLAETLTIGRLGVPATLARTLRSTNSIWVFSLARRIARPERDLAGHRWLRPDSEFDWSSARMASNSRCRARLPGTRRRAAWLARSLGPQPRSAGPRPPRVATGSGSPDDRRLACSNQTEWRGSTRTSRC
jgi:putative transposase